MSPLTGKTASAALEQFLQRAAEDVAEGLRRPATVREYQRKLPRLLAMETEAGWCLADIPYAEITQAHIASVLYTFARTEGVPRKGRRLDDGTREIVPTGQPAKQTVLNARSVLGAFFRDRDMAYAITRKNPAHGIDLRHVIRNRAEKEPVFLVDAELDELIDTVPEGCRSLVTLIGLTGLRSAEARGLRWEDVDLDQRVLRVVGQADEHGGWSPTVKSASSKREVPLTKRVVAALAEQRKLTGSGEFVFATRTGRTRTNANLWRAVRLATIRADLKRVGVHDLRHSFAMNALGRGVPLYVVSKILGHTTPEFTAARYMRASVSLDTKRDAMRAAFDGEEA